MMENKILDVGCGYGFNVYNLSKNKKNDVIGIDLFSDNINICKKRYPGLNFMQMDITRLEFEDKLFDNIYAIEVLEHVDNLVDALNEIKRVLKCGGKLIISVPYEKSERFLLKLRPIYFQEIHHVRIFQGKELENTINELGFKLKIKKGRSFLNHIELYYLFKRSHKGDSQVHVGNWRDTIFGVLLHCFLALFDIELFKTPIKYFPIWIVTLPIGCIINFFGNKFFPKSIYYEFEKL